MEAGDTSDQCLNVSDRQMQAFTANIQKGEVQIPNPGQSGGEDPYDEEGGNQNRNQNDEGANQNRIQDDPALKWSRKLRSNPARKSKDLYCRFHRDHGHTTEDCYVVKEQIEALIRQGKLKKFVRRDNQEASSTQTRGEQGPLGRPSTRHHRGNKYHRQRLGVRSEDDARGIHQPHDNALVVTMTIASFITRRVLIDNRSSADIIYLPTYQQLKIDKKRLRPIDILLVGFTRDKVKPSGVVSLIIEAGTLQSDNDERRRSGEDDLHHQQRTLLLQSHALRIEECRGDLSTVDEQDVSQSDWRGIEANPDKIKVILEMAPPRTVKEVQSLTGKVTALNRFVSRATDSSAFIREEDGVQFPVYYTSKAFQGAEKRYSAMEKLALALVVTTRKLRPYFQAHTIIIFTNHPLRKVMNKPDAAGQLIQWAIELSEFDIEYHPRKAIKAQALADFIAKFKAAREEPSPEKSEEKWKVNIDRSSVKGARGVGVVFKTLEGHLLKHVVQLQYSTTNNEAEYEALLTGLRVAKALGATTLKVQSDSQLVVGQVNSEFEAKEDRIALTGFNDVDIV
uniref:Uncharacterized protein n=1 Tax=Fagus sylvatica TaxID=28930 RepID=A0A2N9FTW6_FAGSY